MSEPVKKRAKTNRSPAYPFYSLERVVQLIVQFYEAAHFHFVPAMVAIDHWGYSHKSSNGQRTIAAVGHFGAIEEKGAGKERAIRLSELGKRIALGHAEQTADYWEAVRQAALAPKIYKLLWDKWGGRLPSDAVIKHHLLLNMEFNPRAVDSFIKDFRATLQFANITPDDVSSDEDHSPSGAESSQPSLFSEAPYTTHAPPAQNGGTSMPALNVAHVGFRTVAIPLFSGEHVTINLPQKMSKKNYDHMKTLVELMLSGMEDEIVQAEDTRDSDEMTEKK